MVQMWELGLVILRLVSIVTQLYSMHLSYNQGQALNVSLPHTLTMLYMQTCRSGRNSVYYVADPNSAGGRNSLEYKLLCVVPFAV